MVYIDARHMAVYKMIVAILNGSTHDVKLIIVYNCKTLEMEKTLCGLFERIIFNLVSEAVWWFPLLPLVQIL